MVLIKKHILGLGYDKVHVDSIVQDLTGEIAELRQQLFDSEEKRVAANQNSSDEERLGLLVELKDCRALLRKKEIEVEELLLKQQSTSAPQNQSAEVAGYRNLLAQKDKEISDLKTDIVSVRRYIAEQTDARPVARDLSRGANFEIIEKIYMRAFDSVKSFTGDARDSMATLTEHVCDELNDNLFNISGLYSTMNKSKVTISALISQAISHFNSIEALLDSFGDESGKIAEYSMMLNKAKANIMDEVEHSVSTFEGEVEEAFFNRQAAESSVPASAPQQVVQQAPVQQAPAQQVPVQQTPIQQTPVIESRYHSTQEEETPALEKDGAVDAIFALEAFMVDMGQDAGMKDAKKIKNESEASAIPSDPVYDPEQDLKNMQKALQQEYAASAPDRKSVV